MVDRVVRLRLASNRVRLMRVTPREVNRLTTLQLPTWIDMIVQGFKALGNRLESSVLQGADRSTLSGLGSSIFLRAEVHRVTADDLAGLGHLPTLANGRFAGCMRGRRRVTSLLLQS